MFLELHFIVSIVVAAVVSLGVMMAFARLISTIFADIFQDKFRINSAFIKYVKYATLLVGVSRGAIAHQLQLDIWSQYDTIKEFAPNLDFDRVAWLTATYATITYATIIETLRALAYMYSALFLIILIAYVIVTARAKSDASD